MADLVAEETIKAVETAESELGSTTTFMATLILGSLVVCIILSLVITRMVVNPLAETQVFAQAVAPRVRPIS